MNHEVVTHWTYEMSTVLAAASGTDTLALYLDSIALFLSDDFLWWDSRRLSSSGAPKTAALQSFASFSPSLSTWSSSKKKDFDFSHTLPKTHTHASDDNLVVEAQAMINYLDPNYKSYSALSSIASWVLTTYPIQSYLDSTTQRYPPWSSTSVYSFLWGALRTLRGSFSGAS